MLVRYGFTLDDIPEPIRDPQTAIRLANLFNDALTTALPHATLEVQFAGSAQNLIYHGLYLHVPLADEDYIRQTATRVIDDIIAKQLRLGRVA